MAQTLAVEKGQTARKGQLLAAMHSLNLARQLAQIEEELQVAQARLDDEQSRLRWDSQNHAIDYIKRWDSLLINRNILNRIRNNLERAQSICGKAIILEQKIVRLVFAEAGQREIVEKMTQARDKLQYRVAEKPTSRKTTADDRRRLEQLQRQCQFATALRT